MAALPKATLQEMTPPGSLSYGRSKSILCEGLSHISPDKLVGVCNMVVERVVIPFPFIVGRNTLGVDLKRRREHRKGAA